MTRTAWKPTIVGLWLTATAGCTSAHIAQIPDAGIHHPLAAPTLPPPAPSPEQLPAPPTAKRVDSTGELELSEVLQSVEQHFPLLMAVEQERGLAAGNRLIAEGAYDLAFRTRGTTQGGSFPNDRLDVLAEQATPFGGASFFTGYRIGQGDFPVYYGDRLTAKGGEFRGGVSVPLLRDGPIDRRRVALRQGQIAEGLADPIIQRARIEYLRTATRYYWNWVAAGDQYRVASELLRIARVRQEGFETQLRAGAISEFVVIDNRRLIAEREGAQIAAERRFQQSSFDLSLFLRDAAGDPVVPIAGRLPQPLQDRKIDAPTTCPIRQEIENAYSLRPELVRFSLLKERAAVDLRYAENQNLPALNAAVATAQDVGKGKKDDGIFSPDQTNVEGSLTLEVPLQRRESQGRLRIAQATMQQLLAQERYTRDAIAAEVQDALSSLDRNFQRLLRAREEQQVARRVADLERERFTKGQSNLLEVNLRELAAAGAEAKVIESIADLYRAIADYRAALGLDARNSGTPR